MKTTLLITAALLGSLASFSQETSAKTEQSAQVNANSGTDVSIKTGVVKTAKHKTTKAAEKVKDAAITEKQAVTTESKNTVSYAKTTVSENSDLAASTHSDLSLDTKKGNKLSNNASLESTKPEGSVSQNMNAPKQKVSTTMQKTKENTMTGIKTTKTKAVHTAVKAKPAAIKMNTKLMASGGLKIK